VVSRKAEEGGDPLFVNPISSGETEREHRERGRKKEKRYANTKNKSYEEAPLKEKEGKEEGARQKSSLNTTGKNKRGARGQRTDW